MARSGIVIFLSITLIVNILFFLAMVLETPDSKPNHKIVIVLASTEPEGAQVFGSVLVDNAEMGNSTLEELFQRQMNYAKFDDSGHYLILSNLMHAADLHSLSTEPLCVGMQASLNQLYKVPEFVSTWPGPISLAVFTADAEFFLAISAIRYLRYCFPNIRSRVSWHLAFPSAGAPNASDLHLATFSAFNCSVDAQENLRRVQATLDKRKVDELAAKRANHQLPYPQNLMRNLARQHCLNEWVMCPDVDMVFPRMDTRMPSLTQSLTKFLQTPKARECSKCAFVFPLYEVEHVNRTLPADKNELNEYIRQGWARQYHGEVFAQNQAASKLKDWARRPEHVDVRVAFTIKYQFWYEPVFVAKQGTPKFDERYVGYGMTRNTQAYEMALAGYTFYLLESVFLNHVWGLQRPGVVEDPVRRLETSMNTQFFSNVHLRELSARYDSDKFNILRYQSRYNKKYKIEMSVAKKPQVKVKMP